MALNERSSLTVVLNIVAVAESPRSYSQVVGLLRLDLLIALKRGHCILAFRAYQKRTIHVIQKERDKIIIDCQIHLPGNLLSLFFFISFKSCNRQTKGQKVRICYEIHILFTYQEKAAKYGLAWGKPRYQSRNRS